MDKEELAQLATFAAVVLITLGLAIQKLGLRQVEQQGSRGKRPHLENLIWWVGALIMAGGYVLSYWAMN